MSVCQIERELRDVSHTLSRAKNEAAKFHSVFEGDEQGGHYTLRTPLGSIVGTYSVTGKRVCFVVEKKPVVVPRVLIEKILDEFLKGD